MWRLASEFSKMKEAVYEKVRKSNVNHCDYRTRNRPALFPNQIEKE